jgi:hypothetical protein
VVDVPRRSEVVARHGERLQGTRAAVRDSVPRFACDQHGVASCARVGGRDHLVLRVVPGGDHAVDRLRRQVRPVCEDDHRCVGVLRQRGQPAAERRAGPALPFGAENGLRRSLDVVGAEDDDDPVDRARAHALEHGLEQQPLLR